MTLWHVFIPACMYLYIVYILGLLVWCEVKRNNQRSKWNTHTHKSQAAAPLQPPTSTTNVYPLHQSMYLPLEHLKGKVKVRGELFFFIFVCDPHSLPHHQVDTHKKIKTFASTNLPTKWSVFISLSLSQSTSFRFH